MNIFKNKFLMASILFLAALFLFNYFAVIIKSSSFENKLDAIMPSDKENFNFSKAIFNVTKLVDKDMDLNWCQTELANLTHDLKAEIGDEANPELRVKIFNNFMFKEKGFHYNERAKNYFMYKIPDKDVSNDEFMSYFTVSSLLKTGEGVCLSLSVLYLMLAEQLDLPIYGSILPGHIFVRYIEDGRSRINIDPAGNGLEFYHYDEAFKIDLNSANGSIFGKKASNYSVLGTYIYNLSLICKRMKRMGDAEILLKKAAEINPGDADVLYELGNSLYEKGKYKEAAEQYAESINLYPDHSYAYSGLGACLFMMNQYDDAEKNVNEALRLDKNNLHAQYWRDRIFKGKKQ